MPRKHLFYLTLLITICCIASTPTGSEALDSTKLQIAEQYYIEKSYRLAADNFRPIMSNPGLSELKKREYAYKYADASWRTREESRYKEAEDILLGIIESKDRNDWWALASESLGDFYILKDKWGQANAIKENYDRARHYWAASSDIEQARERYVGVNFKLGDFISGHWGWYYSGITAIGGGSELIKDPVKDQLGLFTLYEEILNIAKKDENISKAHYSAAMAYYHSTGTNVREYAEKHFIKVIKSYPATEWADDALYYLGQMHERDQDFVKAAEVYGDLTGRYREGMSQWVDDAKRRLEDILNPQISLNVSNAFLPGSEVRMNVNWRNLKDADIKIYGINLSAAMAAPKPSGWAYDTFGFREGYDSYSKLLKHVVESGQYRTLPEVLSFNMALKNEGLHRRYSLQKGLADWRMEDEKAKPNPELGILQPGAYLVTAQIGQEVKSYDLILVSDIGLITKVSGNSALLFAFDGKTGKPKPESKVRMHYSYYSNNGSWVWEELSGVTDTDGLLSVPLKTSERANYNNQHNVFVCVSNGPMQAFSQSNYYSYSHHNKGQWWLYAYSDRPAYRPEEKVSFKGILRNYNGRDFAVTYGRKVKGIVYDARGNKVREKIYTLNQYGSFDDEFILDKTAALGEYRIEIHSQGKNNRLSTATLFRLEEYKLPEFTVEIKSKPKEGAEFSSYKIGDVIDVGVESSYYFGGPVAEAKVEYLVYQNTYNHYYYPSKEYPWYYSQQNSQNYYYGRGTLVDQGKIHTDSAGKAHFTFKTPVKSDYDLRYTIEVRVVDQSRREIKAANEIKIGRTSYLAYLNAKRNLYRPGDRVEIDIKALNLNNEPQAIEGQITIKKNWWKEPVYEMDASGENRKVLQPAHYQETDVTKSFVQTNKKGEALFHFEPQADGFYAVHFMGVDESGKEVNAVTHVYVCDKQSKEIGYKYAGIQIIAENDTVRPGETARFMVVSDRPDSWVLFSSEAQEIHDYQMLHLDGTVKLIEIPMKEDSTPNIFFSALSADNYQVKMHSVEIIVPPEDKFLNVKIISDKKVYQPQEEGVFDILVTDENGDPIVTEVSLGIVDSSVYYIQSEYAKDIREFFYGDKRNHSVRAQNSFNQRGYVRLVRDDDGILLTANELEWRENNAKLMARGGKVSTESDSFRNYNRRSGSANQAFAVGGVADMVAEVSEGEANSLKTPASAVSTKALRKDSGKMDLRQEQSSGELPQPDIRSDFRSTVIWKPTVLTDANGRARAKVKFPDSLTTWRATARSITSATSVGNITHEVRSKKDIIVRLQAPRFFVERDKVTISANVHNYTDKMQKVKVSLNAKGIRVAGKEVVWVDVPANGEHRVDWVTAAEKSGTAELTVMAQTEEKSDAMRREYPVIPHGIEKFIAKATALKAKEIQSLESQFTFEIPEERVEEMTSLQLNVSPSLAISLFDALPYLADYPYGCVEQTMSRFLPSVIVAKTMRDLGLDAKHVNSYISNVLQARGDPKGHPQRREGATFNQIDRLTKDGLHRLYDFQHSDGGWGWWKEGKSDRFMSAYVVWGLSLAQKAGVRIKDDVLQNGVRFLQLQLVEEENNPDMLAWMLHALSEAGSESQFEKKQRMSLWQMRDELNPYSRALFALSEHNRGYLSRAQMLARNLINGVQEDASNGTAHWGESGIHYRWSEGGIEATAFAVKALVNILPDSPYLEPAVKWLSLNRRGASWKNTRDTAIAVLGLSDYLKYSGDLNPNFDYEIYVNGSLAKEGHVDAQNIFTFSRIEILDNDKLKNGINVVDVKFKGNGSFYLSGYLKYFTLEENITPAGNEIFVNRKYFKEARNSTLLKGIKTEWAELAEGESLQSGDRIKVEIILEAKNHYEYLIVEDNKPAGLEAVELKSGSGHAAVLDKEGFETGRQTWLYKEFRDKRAVFFIDKLEEGKHKISYELRAEVPGEFHGMPNQSHAMYVPEIRANSSEARFMITE